MSLIEVIVAIGVVAIGLLGLISVLASCQRASDHGQSISQATAYSRDLLEIIRSRGLAYAGTEGGDLPAPSSGMNDDPEVITFESLPLLDAAPPAHFRNVVDRNDPQNPRQKFRRSIQTERLTDNPNDYNYSLRKITVTVYWRDQGGVQRSVSTVGVTRQVDQ